MDAPKCTPVQKTTGRSALKGFPVSAATSTPFVQFHEHSRGVSYHSSIHAVLLVLSRLEFLQSDEYVPKRGCHASG